MSKKENVTGCDEYDALTAKMAAARADIAAMGKDAVGSLFKRFFTENQKATAVGWHQYTPYFNDGEPCEFSVHDFYYSTKQGVDFSEVTSLDEDEDGAGFVDDYSRAKAGEGALKEAVSTLRRAVDEDIFETAFGDHVMVIATPAGFHVSEYSHD
jgi:hypothetical protein